MKTIKCHTLLWACHISLWACLLTALPLASHAKDIKPLQAARIAERYIKLAPESFAKSATRAADGNTPYYIYNDARGQGFVIVSANDAMGEVLAYSTEGTLDTLNANPCVKLLLESYRQTYEVLKEGDAVVLKQSHIAHNAADADTRSGLFTKTVAPLLKSRWGQEHPFNSLTGYPYSGCVATAVAQMMYYHKWPAQGKGRNEYTVNYYNTTKSADFSLSHYDWNNMLPDYRYPVNANTVQQNAVALLMNDVGVASFMQYTPSASGTQGAMAYRALQNNFDYTAAYVTKAVEGPTRFAEILRQELLNGCPVYLEGHPAGSASGHAWVTDGFDENGLFHMNFGWEGQGDAYYSLTNLSVSQSGSEFQGKPLAFNRAITAILAHPNNGKHPDIDRSLLESSPQLMFNEGGSLTIKDTVGKTFNPMQTLTVDMCSFVNRGNPFKGDIGVAVYDDEGNFHSVVYSDDHADGGLTERIYGADHNGYMGTDYLINQPQSISVNLANMPDGYYRLRPVCVARKEDGTWDEFLPMKKAPVIEVQLTGGSGRISETCSEEARLQLMAQPRLSAPAEQGSKVQAFFTVKNLNGVPRDCYMRVKLLDEDGTVVLSVRTDNATEIEGFTTSEIPILLSFPASIKPARYKVLLEITADEEETQPYPINNIHDKDVAYVEVIKAQPRPIMAQTEVYLADDANDKIESGSIDISNGQLFKIAVSLLASEGRSYEGHITLLAEDVVTKERIKINGIDDNVNVSSSFAVPLFSYWLKNSNQPFADGHTYRFVVMGEIDNEDVELNNPQQPYYYLKRQASILTISQGTSTAIVSTPTDASVQVNRNGNQLSVSGNNILTIRLYNANGILLQQASAIDDRATISLQDTAHGTYLLQVLTAKQRSTYRLMK